MIACNPRTRTKDAILPRSDQRLHPSLRRDVAEASNSLPGSSKYVSATLVGLAMALQRVPLLFLWKRGLVV